MRIGLICGSYPPTKCGVGDFTARLASALAASGNQVEVITSAIREAREEEHVHVRPLVTQWNPGAVPVILQGLREARVEIVNIQYPTQEYGRRTTVNLLPWLTQSRLHLPAIATIHEFGSFTSLGRARLALTAKISRAVITTDDENQRLLCRWTGGPCGKYSLIPIGPNLDRSPPAGYDRTKWRARLGASPTSVVLAYFGFISPSKQVDTLLDAFALACETAPGVDLRLWLLADREPAAERYRGYHTTFGQRLAGFGYRDRVVWTGYLEPSAVSEHLLAADVAVLPFSDGASLRRGSLLAALAHGLPVISTQRPRVSAGSLGKESGLCLVPPSDKSSLTEAILTLAGDCGLRNTLAAQAKQFASTFSWRSIAERTLVVFRQVVEAGGSGSRNA